MNQLLNYKDFQLEYSGDFGGNDELVTAAYDAYIQPREDGITYDLEEFLKSRRSYYEDDELEEVFLEEDIKKLKPTAYMIRPTACVDGRHFVVKSVICTEGIEVLVEGMLYMGNYYLLDLFKRGDNIYIRYGQ